MKFEELRTGQIVQWGNMFCIVLGVRCDLHNILKIDEDDVKVLLYNLIGFSTNYSKEFFQCAETKAFLKKLRDYKLSNPAESNSFSGCYTDVIDIYDKSAKRQDVEQWLLKNKMLSKDVQRYLKEVVFAEDAIETYSKMNIKLEKYYAKVKKQLEKPMQRVEKTVDGGVYYWEFLQRYVIRLNETYMIIINHSLEKKDFILKSFSEYNILKERYEEFHYTILKEPLDSEALQFTGINIFDLDYNKNLRLPLLKKLDTYYKL